LSSWFAAAKGNFFQIPIIAIVFVLVYGFENDFSLKYLKNCQTYCKQKILKKTKCLTFSFKFIKLWENGFRNMSNPLKIFASTNMITINVVMVPVCVRVRVCVCVWDWVIEGISGLRSLRIWCMKTFRECVQIFSTLPRYVIEHFRESEKDLLDLRRKGQFQGNLQNL